MERVFNGKGLSLQAALVFDAHLGVEITPSKARAFHPDDKGTLLVTATYYDRPDVVTTLLESGAALSFKDFMACRFAYMKVLDYPKSKQAKEIMGIIANWAEKEGVDLTRICAEVDAERKSAQKPALPESYEEPHRIKRGPVSSRLR